MERYMRVRSPQVGAWLTLHIRCVVCSMLCFSSRSPRRCPRLWPRGRADGPSEGSMIIMPPQPATYPLTLHSPLLLLDIAQPPLDRKPRPSSPPLEHPQL